MHNKHANYWSSPKMTTSWKPSPSASSGSRRPTHISASQARSCIGSTIRDPKILSWQRVGVNDMKTSDFIILSEQDEVSASAYHFRILLQCVSNYRITTTERFSKRRLDTTNFGCLGLPNVQDHSAVCMSSWISKQKKWLKWSLQAGLCCWEQFFLKYVNRKSELFHYTSEVTCYKWPRRSEILWECLALNFLHAQVPSDPEDHPLRRVCVDVPVHVGNIQQVCGVLVDDFSHFVYFGQVHVFSTCSFRSLLVAMPPKPISQLPCVSAPQQQKHGDKD